MTDEAPLTAPEGADIELPSGRIVWIHSAVRASKGARVDLKVQGLAGGADIRVLSFDVYAAQAAQRLTREAHLTGEEARMVCEDVRRWLQIRQEERARGATLQRRWRIALRQREKSEASAQWHEVDGLGALVAFYRRSHGEPNLLAIWKDAQALAVLDVDWHGKAAQVPPPAEIERLAQTMAPQPLLWWRSRGGGLHALYAAQGHYTADELAVLAGTEVLAQAWVAGSGGTIEVKAEIRHPGSVHDGRSPGPVKSGDADRYLDLSALQRWGRAGASENEVEEVIQDRGWAIGHRLSHDHCVIDPGHASSSPAPVVVMPDGLFCHSCAARTGNGFRSWAAVRRALGYATASDFTLHPIREAAIHVVHWAHVDYLFEGTDTRGLPSNLRQVLYRALLKTVHDPAVEQRRIQMAFHEFMFVRGHGGWLHADTLKPTDRPFGKEDLQVLPSVHRMVSPQEGPAEMVQEQALITAYKANGALPGWTPLVPRRYTPIAGVHNAPSFAAGVQVAPKSGPSRDRVAYVPPGERMPLADAEAEIVRRLPGLDLGYFEAIFIALGCAESGVGPVPILWGSGPSGSAKTGALRALMSMLGEDIEDLGRAKPDRLATLFGEAICKGRAVLFDDFAKDEDRVEDLHDHLLPLVREAYNFHRLHHGSTTVRCDAAIFLTDWHRPAQFTDDVQIGRRIHYYELKHRIRPSWLELGRDFSTWWRETPEARMAADSWFSHKVDQWFPEQDPPENFHHKMRRLGVPTLEEAMSRSDEQDGKTAIVEGLVRLLANVPAEEIAASRKKNLPAGEVAFTFCAKDNPCSVLMTELHDLIGGKFYSTKKIKNLLDSAALSLDKVFDFKEGMRPTFQITVKGNRNHVRLVSKHPEDSRKVLVAGEMFRTIPPKLTLDQCLRGEYSMTVETCPAPGEVTSASTIPQPAPIRRGIKYHLDYETQSMVDLKERGTAVYAADPSTKVLLGVVRSEDLKDWWLWTEKEVPGLAAAMVRKGQELGWDAPLPYVFGMDWLRNLYEQMAAGEAFNVSFEDTISRVTLGLPPVHWEDIMDLAAFHGLPGPRGGLEGLAQELFGIGKDKDGQKIMMRLCKPQKGRGKRAGQVWLVEPTLEDLATLAAYCRKDVELQSRAVAERLGQIVEPAWEDKVRHTNFRMNRRGVLFDQDFGRTLLEFQSNLKAQIAEQIEERTLAFGPPVSATDLSRVEFLRDWFNKHLTSLGATLFPAMEGDLLEDFIAAPAAQGVADTSPGSLGEMLVDVAEARLIFAGNALKKVEKALATIGPDGRARYEFQVYGAHTHRWSGRGIQLQNLKRPLEHDLFPEAIKAVERKDFDAFLDLCDRMKERPSEVLGCCLRAAIVPAPGHKFVVCDYSQVEARALAVLAGAKWMVDEFHEDDRQAALPKEQRDPSRMPDSYCRTAAGLYGVPFVGKKDKAKRQAGKVSDLACGYGGGEGAVTSMGAVYKIDWSEVGMTPKQLAYRWRDKHPEIVMWWKDLETAAKNAVRDKGRTDAQWHWAGEFVAARADGQDVVFRMPSGTTIRYRDMRLDSEGGLVFTQMHDKSGKWIDVRTYGGRLAENITQKVCRDFFATHLVEVEEAGGEPVMVVHDELVTEVADEEVEIAVQEIGRIMSTAPAWMPSMPLRGVAEVMARYGK